MLIHLGLCREIGRRDPGKWGTPTQLHSLGDWGRWYETSLGSNKEEGNTKVSMQGKSAITQVGKKAKKKIRMQVAMMSE